MRQLPDKESLRQHIIKQRDALDLREREWLSLAASKHVLSWPLYRRAKHILLFAGVRSEIQTQFLVQQTIKLGKSVAMPRCVPQTRELLLFEIKAWSDLKPGYYGLLEPDVAAKMIPLSKLDIIIVPGVVFSPQGYRIGYGAGYYDRLLSKAKDIIISGLAFELQVMSSVPQDDHDVPLHYLITEKGIRACGPE
ncbi:MAG TPA: 5-formyltetrahydrofolate cyclo-ligase [bacterium]|jgi:5-formyltetrahydrofolate cyclo-ligase|nr:5-formyltetrahydrofolate cyclo-ligase [bacterium]